MGFRLVIGSLMGFVAVAPSLGETPLGTAFTYQGQLKESGVPFDGTADFLFTLWDASGSGNPPVGGTQVGDVQAINALPVTAGLFTVTLNAGGEFGANAFAGNSRWLQIAVRNTGGGAFTTLAPRQPLTAAPFALSVPGLATTQAGVEVEGDVHAQGQIAASAYTSNSPFIIKVNPLDMECARFEDEHCYLGLGTTEPQARLHVGGVAGVDGIMFPDGSMQTTAAGLGGGDGFWSLSGSNIYNNNGGNVGIGTTTPHHRLRIGGGPTWTANGWAGSLELDNGSALGWRAVNAQGYGRGIGYSGDSLYIFRTSSDPGTSLYPALYDLVIDYAGKIGIGTTAPQSRVDIAATGDGAELLRLSTERPWVFRQVRTGPSAGLQLLSTIGGKKFEITADDGNNVATFLADGVNSKVGIGTTTPGSKLDVIETAPSTAAISGYSSATSCFVAGVGVQGTSNCGYGVRGIDAAGAGYGFGGYFTSASTNGTGVYGLAFASSGTTDGVRGVSYSPSGHGVFGSAANYGVYGEVTLPGRGVTGVATPSGGVSYGVWGQSNSPAGFDVYAGGAGIDYGSSSSIRWKRNVRNIDQPREKIARLRGVYFDWDAAHGGRHDLGMIAEEVGAVLPEIVGYEENGIDAIAMDYSKLTPLLVEAAKDQQKQIDALRQENAELLRRLEALEARPQ